MFFVEVSNKQLKKIDFNQFGTVLAKIALKLYKEEVKNAPVIDPIDATLRLINDYLFSLSQLETNSNNDNSNI